jgi:hypothetical protein
MWGVIGGALGGGVGGLLSGPVSGSSGAVSTLAGGVLGRGVIDTVVDTGVDMARMALSGGITIGGFLDSMASNALMEFSTGGSAPPGSGRAVKNAVDNAIDSSDEQVIRAVDGAAERVNITNDVLERPRAGSALKVDKYHAFNDVVDNYAGVATKSPVNNGDLYQIEGSLNGVPGRFEWIVDSNTGKYPDQVSHRMFVPNGTLVGGR